MNKILILDFGSQYTQLIARRIREEKVYCEIHPFNYSLSEIKNFAPKGIVLSGSPSSVYGAGAPLPDKNIFSLGIPVLGICYGMQAMTHLLGGKVSPANRREYGRAKLEIKDFSSLFKNFEKSPVIDVWMSHGDSVEKIPAGFKQTAFSENTDFAVIENADAKLYGVQFHPEVVHTEKGIEILRNFVFGVCGASADWNMKDFIQAQIKKIREQVGKDNIICGLSGGVDSTVAAVLISKAVGKQLKCIFVNNGVLRLNEEKRVLEFFRNNLNLDVIYADAEKEFLSELNGVEDPEKKRKIIGRVFIEVFDKEAKKIPNVKFLAQGTLYPDVIESVSFKGPSVTIKSHHNVGGLPEKMHLKLVEPFRELFKDEVRLIGEELGIPYEAVHRQPFPGPGLAVRILGEVSSERLKILREADAIVDEEMRKSGFYYKVWQSFAVLLPVKSVGVMGDERTYENTAVIRVVESKDGMTADWVYLPQTVLSTISNRIINEVKGINRVAYDISSKPPATIEWE